MPGAKKAKKKVATKKGVATVSREERIKKLIQNHLVNGSNPKKASDFIRDEVGNMPLALVNDLMGACKIASHRKDLIKDPDFAVHLMNCCYARAVKDNGVDLEVFRNNGLVELFLQIQTAHPYDREVAYSFCLNMAFLLVRPHPEAGDRSFAVEATKRLIEILRNCNYKKYDFGVKSKRKRVFTAKGATNKCTAAGTKISSPESIIELACNALGNIGTAEESCAQLLHSYKEAMGAIQLCRALQVYKSDTRVCSLIIWAFSETVTRELVDPSSLEEDARSNGADQEAKENPPGVTSTKRPFYDVLLKVITAIFHCAEDNRRPKTRKKAISEQEVDNNKSRVTLISRGFAFLYTVCDLSVTRKKDIMEAFPGLLNVAINEKHSASIQLEFLAVCYQVMVGLGGNNPASFPVVNIAKWVQDVISIHGAVQGTLEEAGKIIAVKVFQECKIVALKKVAQEQAEKLNCAKILLWACRVSVQMILISPEKMENGFLPLFVEALKKYGALALQEQCAELEKNSRMIFPKRQKH